MKFPNIALCCARPHWPRHSLSLMAEREVGSPLARCRLRPGWLVRLCNWLPAAGPTIPQLTQFEHAIEVELPFLQMLRPDVQMVPIRRGTAQPLLLESLGQALAAVVQAGKDRVLLLPQAT